MLGEHALSGANMVASLEIVCRQNSSVMLTRNIFGCFAMKSAQFIMLLFWKANPNFIRSVFVYILLRIRKGNSV